MERWEKPHREERYRHRRENPSFSSTLLDAIYRSIDHESGGKGEAAEQVIFYRSETMKKKHSGGGNNNGWKEEEKASLQRACMIDKWMMEKKVSYEKVAGRRKSTADLDNQPRKDFSNSVLLNSSSSSSESSSGGGFSSSESESIYGLSSRSSSTYNMQRSKPIRTSCNSARPERYQTPADDIDKYHHVYHHQRNYAPTQKPKHESSFVKTKSKALKIYGDLKKVKQPISPGGRLASFLNSLFTAGNAKKAKMSSSSGRYEDQSKFMKSDHHHEQTYSNSTCSSASSFSRSCLSKTPSSRGKLSSSNGGAKRSVRFYPVSVIVDEDCRPCGHKNLSETGGGLMAITTTRNPTNEELKYRVMSENRRVEEVARDLLKNYQQKREEFDHHDHHMRDISNGSSEEDEEEIDDDAASYASSDLFELDNLSAIGIERYHEELPVYETTHLGTNRAIANGLIV